MIDLLNKVGLKDVLNAVKSKIPTSLPADGGHADSATNATNAEHAVVADVADGAAAADHAKKADFATNAEHANGADAAINATHADNADTLDNKHASDFAESMHTHYMSEITDFPGSLPADGGDADTVGGHTVGADVPADAVFTDTFINENLLINSDFKINQREIRGVFSDAGKYFVDRWKLISGTVTINSNGTLTLNGTISQILENAAGTDVTASVSAGAVSYDDSTKTFTVTGSGDVISWAKLERGSVATAFTAPDPATELLRCMRYYEVIMTANCDRGIPATLIPFSLQIEADIQFKVPKRAVPSLVSDSLRVVCSTSTGFAVCTASINIHASDAYGLIINTSDAVLSELPSYLLGVTIDTLELLVALAVDAEIY